MTLLGVGVYICLQHSLLRVTLPRVFSSWGKSSSHHPLTATPPTASPSSSVTPLATLLDISHPHRPKSDMIPPAVSRNSVFLHPLNNNG